MTFWSNIFRKQNQGLERRFCLTFFGDLKSFYLKNYAWGDVKMG